MYDLDNLDVVSAEEMEADAAAEKLAAKQNLIKLMIGVVNGTEMPELSQEQRNIRLIDGLNLLLTNEYYA